MIKEDKFYVYIYLDPRKKGAFRYGEFLFDYEPFYVGKGCKNRIYQHLMSYYLEKERKLHKTRKIKKLIKLGFDLKSYVVKIKKDISNKKATELEICLINLIGRRNLPSI